MESGEATCAESLETGRLGCETTCARTPCFIPYSTVTEIYDACHEFHRVATLSTL